jgi:hypothetical protein
MVTARSKTPTDLNCQNTRMVSSNPAHSVDICRRFPGLCSVWQRDRSHIQVDLTRPIQQFAKWCVMKTVKMRYGIKFVIYFTTNVGLCYFKFLDNSVKNAFCYWKQSSRNHYTIFYHLLLLLLFTRMYRTRRPTHYDHLCSTVLPI